MIYKLNRKDLQIKKYQKLIRVLLEELWSWYIMFFNWVPGRIGARLRGYLFALFFKKHGRNILIKENVEIWNPKGLHIGNNSIIGRNSVLNCIGEVYIEDDVKMGPGVNIFTMNHTTVDSGMICKKKVLLPVRIGNNVWIGANAIILPGVTIENNSVICAGAVVTKSFSEGAFLAGVPAKNIRKIEN